MKYLITSAMIIDIPTPEDAEELRATMEQHFFDEANRTASEVLDAENIPNDQRAELELELAMAITILGTAITPIPNQMLFGVGK